ncbi:hypothetical protein MYSTI_02201 [Myxococcus stipitatus DSM 14675]|uniref:Uncharacterized protein n=1 Tax=Myxococcus stipitatus (strain DSM 14675 / JCM 12634 / Mx s8) TaxID=1278073 RepID=L7U5Z4_MYXSD|nr:hypothetical protein MYSTI_02201 [Myxococcus stipitatus DSM 14675]
MAKGKRFLRDNGLSIALLVLFGLSLIGHSIAGHLHSNEEARAHGQPLSSFGQYLSSGDFLESVFENWESEFLQMAAYVLLAALLFQRGSGESRDPDANPAEEEDDLKAEPDSPASVKRGGLRLKLYSHSLSVTFALSLESRRTWAGDRARPRSPARAGAASAARPGWEARGSAAGSW